MGTSPRIVLLDAFLVYYFDDGAQSLEQAAPIRLGSNAHGVVVDRFDALDRRQEDCVWRAQIGAEQAIEGIDHIGGGAMFIVVEIGVVRNLKFPGRVI